MNTKKATITIGMVTQFRSALNKGGLTSNDEERFWTSQNDIISLHHHTSL